MTKFQLYTVPGQVIYNATRQLVLRSVDGIVFVADSQWEKMEENVESFRNLEENLAQQNISIDEIPYVLQYNKRDLPNIAPVNYLEFLLNNRKKRVAELRSHLEHRPERLRLAQRRLANAAPQVQQQGDVSATAAPLPVADPVEPPAPKIASSSHGMNSIPALTIENVASLDGILGDFLKKADAESDCRDRSRRQRHFAVRRYLRHGCDDHRGPRRGILRRDQGAGPPDRRGRVQCALPSGQWQPHFHELGRR